MNTRNRLLSALACALVVTIPALLYGAGSLSQLTSDNMSSAGTRMVHYRDTDLVSVNADTNILPAAITPQFGSSTLEIDIQLATSRVVKLIAIRTGNTSKALLLNKNVALPAGVPVKLTRSIAKGITYQLQLVGGASAIDYIVVTECSGATASRGGEDGEGAVTEILGTTNQITATRTANSYTLTTPQNTHTAATPTFAGLTLSSPLTVANGGTGLATFSAANRIPFSTGATTLAATTVTDVMDVPLGSTRGSVPYRGAGGWAGLAPGTAGHVLTSNGAGADPSYQAASGGGLSTGHVYGFGIRWDSAVKVTVSPGSCRSADDTSNISIGGNGSLNPITITTASDIDQKQLVATFTTTDTDATATASASIFAEMNGRSLGNCSTTTTTLTGVDLISRRKLAAGDIVRVGAGGAARVVSVDSETQATLVAELPGGNTATAAATVYENVVLKIAAQAAVRVNTIADNGTDIELAAAASATAATQTTLLGSEIASCWYSIFAVAQPGDPTGGAVFYSTQRTAPYLDAFTGWETFTAYRLIGKVYNNSSGDLKPFSESGSGSDRTYTWEDANTYDVVAGGSATSWTSVVCSASIPPGARRALFALVSFHPNADDRTLSIRARGRGTADVTRNLLSKAHTSTESASIVPCAVDGAQAIDYAFDASAGGAAYIGVAGFYLEL